MLVRNHTVLKALKTWHEVLTFTVDLKAYFFHLLRFYYEVESGWITEPGNPAVEIVSVGFILC